MAGGPGGYVFPQKAAPLPVGERGIASLTHPEVGTLRFRSNPKEFNWSYTLNKRIDQTYGGRVIQLLGTRIEDFTFTADCGTGRWAYMNKVAKYMRDVMIAQRGGVPATFEYTTRGWKFNAYVVSVPFADAVEEVLREFEVSLKVQEDVSGLMSRNTLTAELRRLQDGIAFRRSRYNDPLYNNQAGQVSDSESFQAGALQVADALQGAAAALNFNFLPQNPVGLSSLINSFTGGGANQNGAQ
jgi:hypothetical protein